MTAAVEIRDLVFSYGENKVLDSISLAVERGEMVGILGPNGSGKTTLLKIVSAVLRGEGEIKLAGKAIQSYHRRELSRLFAVVPQESAIAFPYTVAEIVLMARATFHSPLAFEGEADLKVARKSMEQTDTWLLADRYLHELSGGEKQRVMIARALAQEPQLILLDEPSAFLDLKHQVQILDLLRELNREQGLTIIAALHDLNLAGHYFNRLVMLEGGKIYLDGTPASVLTEQTIFDVYGISVTVETTRRHGKPYLVLDHD
jgi:iron complex transport system ATP-binding protein